MREIKLELITKNIEGMLKTACEYIDDDILNLLCKSKENEKSLLAKDIIGKIIENDLLARKTESPMCQDTGIVVCFLEIGNEVYINGDIYEAINEGIRNAYINNYFRKSVCNSPLERINTLDNTPAIFHTKIVMGDKIKIRLACKGAGSENMSAIKMANPQEGITGIKEFVLDVIKKAGGKPCPPYIVGVGIGGDFEKCALLSKEALFEKLPNSNEKERELENILFEEINKLGIGAMGFGGTQTCMRVRVKTYPCHIASMPISVNIDCHASRHIERII